MNRLDKVIQRCRRWQTGRPNQGRCMSRRSRRSQSCRGRPNRSCRRRQRNMDRTISSIKRVSKGIITIVTHREKNFKQECEWIIRLVRISWAMATEIKQNFRTQKFKIKKCLTTLEIDLVLNFKAHEILTNDSKQTQWKCDESHRRLSPSFLTTMGIFDIGWIELFQVDNCPWNEMMKFQRVDGKWSINLLVKLEMTNRSKKDCFFMRIVWTINEYHPRKISSKSASE